MTADEMLTRLGEIRDAIEAARTAQDTSALYSLTGERDELKLTLEELQQPTLAELESELASLRDRLGSFDLPIGGLTAMSGGGSSDGGTAFSAQTVIAAQQSVRQQRDDMGIDRVVQRISHLEERLRNLDPQ